MQQVRARVAWERWRRVLEELCMSPARLRFYRWLYVTGRLTDDYQQRGCDESAK